MRSLNPPEIQKKRKQFPQINKVFIIASSTNKTFFLAFGFQFPNPPVASGLAG